MLDPVTLATLTSAISSLGVEVMRGTASEAGKTAWQKICSVFKWEADTPSPSQNPQAIAQTLHDSPELSPILLQILQANDSIGASGHIAKNLVIGNTISTLNMS